MQAAIVPLIVGGIVSAGAAFISYSEFRRLKKLILAKHNIIKMQGEMIKNYINALALQKKVNEKQNEIIQIQEKRLALCQTGQTSLPSENEVTNQ